MYRGGNRYDLYFEAFADELDCRAARAPGANCARSCSATPRASNITCARIPTTGSTGMISGISKLRRRREPVCCATLLCADAAVRGGACRRRAAQPRRRSPGPQARARRRAPPFTEVRFSRPARSSADPARRTRIPRPRPASRKRVDAPYREHTTIADGQATVQRGERAAAHVLAGPGAGAGRLPARLRRAARRRRGDAGAAISTLAAQRRSRERGICS